MWCAKVKLLSWMNSQGVPYKSRRLKGPMGFATFDGVYLNLDVILNYNPSLLFFVILHETAHYKRIKDSDYNSVSHPN